MPLGRTCNLFDLILHSIGVLVAETAQRYQQGESCRGEEHGKKTTSVRPQVTKQRVPMRGKRCL